ncbi:MAG: hypothetical protein M3326_16045 [Actinomycetota bacterium]|nr:hypothetical protein [Actinomycetota bacterium]
MISWATILRGAGLTALFSAAVLLVVVRERRPWVLSVAVAASALGPVTWNAILRATHASRFFTDAPIAVFPVSWQDTGSGVFAVALAAVALGLGPLRQERSQRLMLVALLTGAVALAVDVYLY